MVAERSSVVDDEAPATGDTGGTGGKAPPAPPVPPAPEEGQAPAGPARWAAAREVAILLGLAVVVAILVKTFVAQAFWIPSGSMIPQLEINDRVVVSKLAYRLHEPRRGDVIVFEAPPSQQPHTVQHDALVVSWLRSAGEAIGLVAPSTEDFIKRVIGLPGDTVEARNGVVFVNGRRLIEPYLPPGTTTSDFGPVVVPPGHLWVLGDNRGDSCDSRCFPEGPITRSSVVGRAILRVWPPTHLSFL